MAEAAAGADVAIVGAGLSGLAAARMLADSGREVVVLEARERVGGRLLNASLGDGVLVELGGQWVGSDHARVRTLATELGLDTFPQLGAGKNLLDVGGKRRLYRGTIPRLGPSVLWDVFLARRRLARLVGEVDPERPWAAPRAVQLDGQTLADWCAANLRTAIARELIGLTGRTVWGAGPEELSMLHGSVRVHADGVEVEAERAILALPPVPAGRIEFEPGLPPQRQRLVERFKPGMLDKCIALYEAPFWREDGLSGESVSDAGPVTLTFDCSPRDGSAGVLLGFVGGPDARRMEGLDAASRRAAVLGCFERLFGSVAARPLDYAEQEWTAEEWIGGGPTSSFGPRGWTECGPGLREPVGRIHWAGTETATVWSGYMEGALQAGERAAAEVAVR